LLIGGGGGGGRDERGEEMVWRMDEWMVEGMDGENFVHDLGDLDVNAITPVLRPFWFICLHSSRCRYRTHRRRRVRAYDGWAQTPHNWRI